MKGPKMKAISYGYFDLFRYATAVELLAAAIGVVMGLLTACGLPIAIVLYGEMTTLLVDRTIAIGTSSDTILLKAFGGGEILTNGTREMNNAAMLNDAVSYVYSNLTFCIIQFISATLCVQTLNWSAHRQICRIRQLFFQSIIRQDMSWFDTETNLNFASRITEDLERLKEGIGEKIGQFSYLVFSFLICLIISFVYGWELTLVVFVAVPIMITSSALVSKYQTKLTEKELQMYSFAGTAAEEVLSSIRTVAAFNGEEKEVERYGKRLKPAEICGKKRGFLTGFGAGFTWLMMYMMYALSFWYGVKMIIRDKDQPREQKIYDPGVLTIILFNIIAGAQNFIMSAPHMEAFAAARGSGKSIFSLMDRVPKIDSLSDTGTKIKSVKGIIELNDVWFNYPSRPDVKVLRGLTLKVNAGETVALVGPSGCGKSTVLQLVQRMYDPESGKVSIDGEPLTSLNIESTRSHIGVVGQEPILFSGTIKENIALGKQGKASDKQIESAAKSANCHDFITHLPNSYNTVIGERGAQLSGGQKQRIAIARSLIRDPKILLLDEATSALDMRSERRVQAALDQASKGRTTLVVTHRLSTIRNASRIVYIDQGQIAEAGTHEQLMAAKGLYHELVQADLENRKTETETLAHGSSDEVIPQQQETAELDFKTKIPSFSTRRISTRRESATSDHRYSSIGNLKRMPSRSNSMTSLSSFGRHQGIPQVESEVIAEDEEVEPVSNFALLKLNSKEWPFLVFGAIASAVVGGVLPVYSVLFAEVFGEFSNPDGQSMMESINFYAIFFVCFGILCGVGTFAQTYLFTISGLKLTTRLRVLTFSSYLKQEIGWFDDNKNSVGALCSRLFSDASAVQGATGMRIGTILQGISTLVIGILISFVYSWKVTLVSTVSIPLVLGGIFLEGHVTRETQVREKKAMEGATSVATEAIMNIRTVQSLGVERNFLEKYGVSLAEAAKAGGASKRLRGMVYAIGVSVPTLGYSMSYAYGLSLVANEGLPYKSVILITEALIFGSWMLGQVLVFAPNFNAARISGSRVMALLQRKTKIFSNPGIKDNETWTANGDLSWKSVQFSYPTRPDVTILRGLDLNIHAGQSVALVGHSGCGKSTCLQLLQRLYDPSQGAVLMDNKNIASELTIPHLRAQLGIVSQEPVLFDRTVAENIAYGDNSRDVPLEQVIAAAKSANIHQFISGLPMGYDTSLGSKGAQLSGGQKQRIAIARALVRNPRVLLLDEATSALDTQSEKSVQEALDVAKEGRTSITIAHRLATIQNSDVICVIDKGKVVEKGNHSELMDLQGVYYELHCLQSAALDAMNDK